ncbi:PREDICTED: pre-mRNA-splicing factor [Prunus dulcis]|uniref:PREDICTED: pre-mRNA-splicing factor n=1 Tax=Prunus dulcis TaxID=3755 RepID=A0A5E4F602_PRUDU|nr:PREDICTED: pre-mRNA-splicing factor [Prunus dulcis]
MLPPLSRRRLLITSHDRPPPPGLHLLPPPGPDPRPPVKNLGCPLRPKQAHFLKTYSQECPVKNLLYQKQEREAVMLVKKQKTYSLLDDDDGDRSSAQVVSESRKADSIRNDSGRRS